MAVRRIATDRRDLIRQLADILAAFLPLTARSQNMVAFQTIFTESGIAHYLVRRGQKTGTSVRLGKSLSPTPGIALYAHTEDRTCSDWLC